MMQQVKNCEIKKTQMLFNEIEKDYDYILPRINKDVYRKCKQIYCPYERAHLDKLS